jgi:hypothetical protein
VHKDDHLSLSAHKQRKVEFPLSQFKKCVAKAKVKAKVSVTRTLKPNIGIAASLFTFVLSFSKKQ